MKNKIIFTLIFFLILIPLKITKYQMLLANSGDINFLAISDVHVSDKTNVYPAMQEKVNLVSKMKEYISTYNIKAVLMPGDLTDACNNSQGTFNSFLTKWYNPLQESLNQTDGYLMPTIGNHDQYIGGTITGNGLTLDWLDAPWWWIDQNKLCKPNRVKTLNNFNPVKGPNWRYGININGIHFISLGAGPRSGKNVNGRYSGATEWLKQYLTKQVKSEDPIVLFFHIPVAGPSLGFMRKQDADDFYNVIKPYKVKALIVGHTHQNFTLKFHNIPQFDVSGTQFLFIKFLNKEIAEALWVDKKGVATDTLIKVAAHNCNGPTNPDFSENNITENPWIRETS